MTRHAIALLAALALLGTARLAAQPSGAGDPAARRAAVLAKLPAPGAAQQRSLAAVREDLTAIAASLEASEPQLARLARDLQGLARSPAPALTRELARSLQTALTDVEISPAQVARLAENLWARLAGPPLGVPEAEVLEADVEALLASVGVDGRDVQDVIADLRALAPRDRR